MTTRFKLSKKEWRELLFKFILVLVTYVIVGAPFKALEIIPGVTELRPVNAVPILAGLTCGWIGAIACAFGNLICDLFGTFNEYSVAGSIANFLAAYIPYKLWYLLTNEAPNVKTLSRVGTFIIVSANAAAVVALVIGIPYCLTQPELGSTITWTIFCNHFIFATFIGLPVLAVILTDVVGLKPTEKRTHRILNILVSKTGRRVPSIRFAKQKTRLVVAVITIGISFALIMLAHAIGFFEIPVTSPVLVICLLLCFIALFILCF